MDPANIAKVLILFAKTSNFSFKGVILSSLELSTILLIFPFVFSSHIAITMAFPFPPIQSVPDRIIGEIYFFDSIFISFFGYGLTFPC